MGFREWKGILLEAQAQRKEWEKRIPGIRTMCQIPVGEKCDTRKKGFMTREDGLAVWGEGGLAKWLVLSVPYRLYWRMQQGARNKFRQMALGLIPYHPALMHTCLLKSLGASLLLQSLLLSIFRTSPGLPGTLPRRGAA